MICKYMKMIKDFIHKFKKRQNRYVYLPKLSCFFYLIPAILLIFILIAGTVYGAGLIEEAVGTQNLYSKYALDNYQLDFYVDTGWDWLPWNWTDGIGKQVMYGLYAITNFIWIIGLYLSSATGYIVEQAYKLDFISDTAGAIGKNIQTMAGISESGFSNEGFYVGFLLLFVMFLGIYTAYTGLLKRESTKALSSLISFFIVFILSASFIAYAPDYITMLNDFSKDVSTSALNLGTKMVLPGSDIKGSESVDVIRDTLFSIQVIKPWYVLEYGDGNETSEDILSISPDTNKGKDRERAVKAEIEENANEYMSVTKVIVRLGMVVFLFIFNIGISIFVFLLSGIMIFSQILFIIYSVFLPIAFLFSLLPGFGNMGKKAVEKLFNTIMLRAGISIVISLTFSISAMIYSLTKDKSFFIIAFLQVVCFAGIYLKFGDIMSMFSLQSNESRSLGRSILKKPYMMIDSKARQVKANIGRSFTDSKKEGLKAGDYAKDKKGKTLILSSNKNAHVREKTLNEDYQDNFSDTQKKQSYQNSAKIKSNISEPSYIEKNLVKAEHKTGKNKAFMETYKFGAKVSDKNKTYAKADKKAYLKSPKLKTSDIRENTVENVGNVQKTFSYKTQRTSGDKKDANITGSSMPATALRAKKDMESRALSAKAFSEKRENNRQKDTYAVGERYSGESDLSMKNIRHKRINTVKNGINRKMDYSDTSYMKSSIDNLRISDIQSTDIKKYYATDSGKVGKNKSNKFLFRDRKLKTDNLILSHMYDKTVAKKDENNDSKEKGARKR